MGSGIFREYLRSAPQNVEMNPLAKKKTNDDDPIPAPLQAKTALNGPPLSINISSNRLRYFPGRYKHLILIASGTGLAPLLTLMNTVVNNKQDQAYVSVLYITRGTGDYGLTLL